MNSMDIIIRSAKEITKEFSNEVGKIAKLYMRQLTAQLVGAGVPVAYLPYAYKIVFEGQRRWRVLPKDKYLISALNGVVVDEMVVPNYNRSQKADQDYSANINEALKETAKWARSHLARPMQHTYTKIATKYAIKANKEMPEYSVGEWLEDFQQTISESPSLYPGGNRTAEILHTILK